jgi:branched-chain amino acid transport system ATP-binding protein
MRLEIKDLRVHYGKIEAIKGVSVVVNEGEIVTLIGANGAGKTTILKTISGLRNVSSGSINFDGQDLNKIPAHERVDLGISQVPEGRGIFAGMTVLENLEMGKFNRKDRKFERAHRTGGWNSLWWRTADACDGTRFDGTPKGSSP